MKKLILFMIIPFAVFLVTSCDTNNAPDNTPTTGSIYLTSNPSGAAIWLDGSNKNLTTPDTLKDVSEGVHTVILSLPDYDDTTFSISVSAGQVSVVTNIALISSVILEHFTDPIQIFETVGTSANQPSGLDLSTGKAWGVSSDSNKVVDIYYSSNGYLVQSANLNTTQNLIRETDFYVGNTNDLFDEQNSPLNTNSWAQSISDTETNYVFLYDHDGHYSKLRITSRGGGAPGDPAWVKVIWLYNHKTSDPRF